MMNNTSRVEEPQEFDDIFRENLSSYVRIGNKTYLLEEVPSDDIDLEQELRAFYNDKYRNAASKLGNVLKTDISNEWEAQINHIRKHSQKSSYTIPDNLIGKAVMVWRKELLELRTILYAPNTIITSRSRIRDFVPSDDCTRHDIFKDTNGEYYGSDTVLVVKVRRKFATPMTYGYCARTNMLYTPFGTTYHTFSRDGRDVCTGNGKASDYWKLQGRAFIEAMNQINTFSPASRSISVRKASGEVTNVGLGDLLEISNIISVTKREERTWTVS